jgi:acyl-CoA thioesterase-1
MVRAAALVLASLATLGVGAACSGEAERRLPGERAAAIRYVALGDSTVEGVGASARERNYVSRLHTRLRAIYPRAEVENLGRAGATSADVLTDQLSRAEDSKPDLVTLSVGPNDVTKGVAVERFEKNVETIFRRLRIATSAVVVATLLPDLAITPRFRDAPEREAVARRAVVFNDALARAAKLHGVVLVDLYPASRAEVPQRPELLAGDGYHPSDAGYERWAELMWERVVPLTAAR